MLCVKLTKWSRSLNGNAKLSLDFGNAIAECVELLSGRPLVELVLDDVEMAAHALEALASLGTEGGEDFALLGDFASDGLEKIAIREFLFWHKFSVRGDKYKFNTCEESVKFPLLIHFGDVGRLLLLLPRVCQREPRRLLR